MSSEHGTESVTVQLLVADTGNRTAIHSMLSDHFDVETDASVGDADLYLVEDQLFSDYHEALRDRVLQEHPTFCPVVVIRRGTTNLTCGLLGESGPDDPILVDDIVDAPIDRPLIVQRLRSLIVRRRQSQTLSQYASTLEQREHELRRFKRGVESTGNGIAITDPAGTIEYVNPAFEQTTAYPEEELIGRSPRMLQPEGATAMFDTEFWRTMTGRSEWSGEVVLQRPDETRCVADITVTPLHDDEHIEGFVLVMNDITERIQREQQLQSREKELDLLRQILTRYLRHNLRNDLNVIWGYAQSLADSDSLSAQQRQGAEQIVTAAKQLMEKSETARIFSTLLDRDTELSAHELPEIVTDAACTVSEQYPTVDIQLDVPETCQIHAREGIRNAIEELLENAVRHNDASSPWVRIQIQEADGVRLAIEDNGPGIPALELAALERGGETQLSHSQGIGLWLSKWVLEGIGGELSLERTDVGTRVVVEFPSPDRMSDPGLNVPDLKEREQRLQTVIDRMTDAIVEVNGSWECTFLDTRAEEILGVDADEVLGRRFWDVFSDTHETRFEGVIRDVMDARSSASIEEYHPGLDRWIEVHVYPEFDGGLSLYLRDATERNRREQELEQAHERTELALKVTETTIWEWDFQNDSVTTRPDVHVGFDSVVTSVDDFIQEIHPDDRSRVQETLRAAIDSGEAYQTEFRAPTDEGIEWIEDYGEIRRDDGVPIEMIGISRNITERKEREQALQERVKELTTIYDATQVFEATDEPLEKTLKAFIETIPKSFQHPDLTEVRLTYKEIEVSTAGFDPRDRAFSTQADIEGEGTLSLVVAYRTDQSGGSGDPILPEETQLLETLTRIATGHVKRRAYLTELERTEDLLTNAERLGDVGAWELDLSIEEVLWTEGTRRIHGVTDEFDPTFETALEFVHPDDRETVATAVESCVETGESFELEFRIHTEDGTKRWVHVEGRPANRSEGQQVVRGYLQDVTERKERERALEHAKQRLDLAFQETHVGVWEWNIETDDLYWSDELLDVLGLDRDAFDAEVDQFETRLHPDDADRVEAKIARAVETGEPYRVEQRIANADGEYVWFDVRGQVIEDGSPLMIGIAIDITDRKERELQLQRQRDRLEEFTSVASHDLRAPLNVVEGRLNLAKEDCDSIHLDAIEAAVVRMNRIIDDLLWLAHEGRDIGSMDAIGVRDIVDDAWRMVVDDASQATLRYADDELATATIEADGDRLSQLLENLFRNALAHGGEDVTVRVGTLDDGFYIEDDGTGIPADVREDVFDVGYSTLQDGTGLGLSIIKQIADAHGWEVTISDGTDGGARFEITGVELQGE